MRQLTLVTLIACGLVTTASAGELFVSINSGNAMAQGAGLMLAGQALAQKSNVRVLLCDTAADIAVVEKEMSTLKPLKPLNLTPQQMLQNLIKSGAQVEVCGLYLPNTGRQASELISGVTPAKPSEVAAHLLKPGIQTLSF